MLSQRDEITAAADYLFNLPHPVLCGQMDFVEEVVQGGSLNHSLLWRSSLQNRACE